MGRKKKAKASSQLPTPKPVTDGDDDDGDGDDYSNYAHELLYGTNEFYLAKERRREERRIAMNKKKQQKEEEDKQKGENTNNKKKEDSTNHEVLTHSFTNKQCKEMYGRTAHVRIPDDRIFQYFQLTQELGYKAQGDTIAWLMDQAQPAVIKLLENSGMPSEQHGNNQIENAETETKTSTSCNLDALQLWKKFQVNQIWALWDDEFDGMPRLYARIHKLLFEELKIEVAFLEPVPTTDQELQWLADKPMACGTFKEATSTTAIEILAFSHQVDFGKESFMARPSYKIFPNKCEIWALYKDWNINWTLHDFSHCRYDMVEVVSDLCDESVITGICLTNIGGVGDGDVYRRQVHGHDGLVKWQQFSGTQLLQFSHRILASKLKVQEMNSVPVESWKLNSEAVPLQFRAGCT